MYVLLCSTVFPATNQRNGNYSILACKWREHRNPPNQPWDSGPVPYCWRLWFLYVPWPLHSHCCAPCKVHQGNTRTTCLCYRASLVWTKKKLSNPTRTRNCGCHTHRRPELWDLQWKRTSSHRFWWRSSWGTFALQLEFNSVPQR